jgi:hypothetical protein
MKTGDMVYMKAKYSFFALLCGAALSSCATQVSYFNVISTRYVDWDRADEFIRGDKPVRGEDIAKIIVLVPSRAEVSLDVAVDKALQQIPGAIALVDVRVSYKYFYVPLIYGEMGYIVEGRVLIDPLVQAKNTPNHPLFYTND